MPRTEKSTQAQQLLLTALRSTPGQGMTEGALRRMTNLNPSIFQEAMHLLIETQQVAVSQRNGRQTQNEYHLVQRQEVREVKDRPLSLLATMVLERLNTRAEGARGLARALDIDLSWVQQVLDELEAAGQVSRSQVGMLVIYRGIGFK